MSREDDIDDLIKRLAELARRANDLGLGGSDEVPHYRAVVWDGRWNYSAVDTPTSAATSSRLGRTRFQPVTRASTWLAGERSMHLTPVQDFAKLWSAEFSRKGA